jgi:hypothetical protein
LSPVYFGRVECSIQVCHQEGDALVVGRVYWTDSDTQYIEVKVCQRHAELLAGRKVEVIYPSRGSPKEG